MSKVVIIDYDMGNLFSVQQACANVGLETVISKNTEEIKSANAIILPGVGSFNEAMLNLSKFDLIGPIKSSVNNKIPLLGVCLGMQLLFEESEEFGNTQGLGLVKGSVIKFPDQDYNGSKVKIPQINWNKIYYPENRNSFNNPLLKDIKENEFMYFVHSYYVSNKEIDTVSCITKYADIEYCSGIKKDNIIAFQFHPEKSATEGLKIYSNFKQMIEYGAK